MLDTRAGGINTTVYLYPGGANAHLFVSATSLQVSSGIETYVSAASRIKEELEFSSVDSCAKTSTRAGIIEMNDGPWATSIPE